MTETPSRGRETSNALTEIRTVHSRAKDAIATLSRTGGSETRHIPPGMDDDGYVAGYHETFQDPDAAEMIAVLEDFVAKADKWACTGRTLKGR